MNDNAPLADVVEKALALSSALENAKRQAAGAPFRDYPHGLERALSATLDAWQRTAAGRLALGLAPMASAAERQRQTAACDLAHAEKQLTAARAVVVAPEYAGDKRARISQAAEHVARSRRRLAELDGDTNGYRSWLRAFLIDVRAALDAANIIERPSLAALRERDRVRDAAELDQADRLGALARQAGL